MARRKANDTKPHPYSTEALLGVTPPAGTGLVRLGDLDQPGANMQGPDDAGDLPDELDDSAEAALSEALNELGESEGSKIVVYRYDNEKKREAYLFQCPPQGFSIDEIAKRYGGGDYSVRVYRAPGNRLVTRKLLAIEEPKNTAVAVVGGGGDVMTAMREMMREMNAAMMQQQNELLKTLVMNRAPAGPPQSLTEMIMALKALQDMNPTPKPAGGPMQSLKEMKELMTIMTDMNPVPPGADAETAIGMRVFERTMGKLFEMMEKRGSAEPPQSGAAVALPGAVALPQTGAPDAEQPTEDDDMKAFIMQGVLLAKENASVDQPAALIAEHAPDRMLADLCDDPEWFKKICELVPEAANYPLWFQQLRDKVDKLTEEPEPGENAPTS